MAKNNKKITKSVKVKNHKPAPKAAAKKSDAKPDKKAKNSNGLTDKSKKNLSAKVQDKKKSASIKNSNNAKHQKEDVELKTKSKISHNVEGETDSTEKKAKKSPKKSATKTPAKTDELDLDTDFLADDDGVNEIEEYEEELKEVEALDETTEEEEVDLQDTREIGDEEVYLTDAEGRRYCRSRDCDQIATVDAYCRYHYLLFWKKIQIRKKILADGKLERYIEELTSRYPDKFLEMIRRDLRTEKDFLVAIQELEIDESGIENDFEEDTQSFIEEVRGLGESNPTMDDEDF